MPDLINSTSNPHIRKILKLQSGSRERKSQNLFVIEGYREIYRAIVSGIEIKDLYICNELDRQGRRGDLLQLDEKMMIYEVGQNAFERIAYREGSDGLIALAVPRNLGLNELLLSTIRCYWSWNLLKNPVTWGPLCGLLMQPELML